MLQFLSCFFFQHGFVFRVKVASHSEVSLLQRVTRADGSIVFIENEASTSLRLELSVLPEYASSISA